ncbi:tetratricopeptide repeat protein [Desulfococcaceae bacterium HSG7]|nr:tetratricopeptide repeat protein [Desulfococcaceae bacterium HSG7]
MNNYRFHRYFLAGWFLYFACVSNAYCKQPAQITTSGNKSPAVKTTSGDVNITYGISEEKFQKISEKLGITKAALKSFFKILEQKHAPPKDIVSKLRVITQLYKELHQDAVKINSGDININYYGISEEKFQKLSKKLGITKAALKSFFKILEQKHVSPKDIVSELRKISQFYKELHQNLADFQSNDPIIAKLQQNAKRALEDGDFELADKLINQAKEKEIRAARQLIEIANKRLLSAAASAAANGDLKNTQLDYKGAAAYFREAVDLVPKENETLLAEYLKKQGDALYYAGKYTQAEASLKRSMKIRERVLGSRHPDFAAYLNNLAELYRTQGRYEAAEPLYKRSLAIMENVLGKEHPSLATTINNLAGLYEAQGRYEEAEPLYKCSLAIKEKILGTEHPSFAATLSNLAGLYEAQGRYEEAEPFYNRSLAIKEKVLGTEHPSLATTLNKLTALYYAQGRYEEAEPLYKRSLAIKEKVLGTEHPSLAATLSNLAGLYEAQGRYEEAEPLYKRSLAITEKVLGSEHPSLATTLNNLAGLYEAQGRYEEAEPLYKRSLAIALKALGPDHPNVKTIRNNLKRFNASKTKIKGIK